MKTKDWAAFVILSLAWGSSFFWIKIAIREIGPFTLVTFRVLLGVVGLLAVTLVKRPPLPRSLRPWLSLAVLGAFNVAIPFTLISWSETLIDSAVGSVLNSSLPLFTAVYAHFLVADDRLNLQKGAGLLTGFLGVVVLAWRNVGESGASSLLGIFAFLLAVNFYALSAIFIRRYVKGISNIVQSLGQLVAADAIMWVVTPFAESPFHFPQLPLTWIALVWLGLIGSCLAYLLYFHLINNVGPTRSTQVAYTFPVVGIILGTLFLGESFDLRLVLGAALVIASILIVNRAGQKTNAG
jgi:drug/metabolite transporter (DMT)-like permease